MPSRTTNGMNHCHTGISPMEMNATPRSVPPRSKIPSSPILPTSLFTEKLVEKTPHPKPGDHQPGVRIVDAESIGQRRSQIGQSPKNKETFEQYCAENRWRVRAF